MDYLISIMLFAISTSITPGPNNIMVMTSSLNYGAKKSLPLLSGICVGFALMLLLVGLGMGELFNLFPALSLIIKCIGTIYLLYLAWLIVNSGSVSSNIQKAKPLGFFKGAIFQWVNAKAWVVAIGAIAAFTSSGEENLIQNLTISLAFLVFSFPCVGVWLLFGSLLREKLQNQQHLKLFNVVMSLLLVLSVLPVLSDVINQLRSHYL